MKKKDINKLSTEEKREIEETIFTSPVGSINKLRQFTGCSITEGKTWVNVRREELYQESIPPCPYCGEKLRTPAAKQCRFCWRDWHDESNIKFLE